MLFRLSEMNLLDPIALWPSIFHTLVAAFAVSYVGLVQKKGRIHEKVTTHLAELGVFRRQTIFQRTSIAVECVCLGSWPSSSLSIVFVGA